MGTYQLTSGNMSWNPLMFTVLRVAIGWHFFWEGWIKMSQPGWTAEGYLTNAYGPLAPVFHWIAETPVLMAMSDFLMPWMLLLSGLGLMLGVFSRLSVVAAMGLLLMFILAMPAYEYVSGGPVESWQSVQFSMDHALWAGKHAYQTEGSYFLINKNIIEFLALAGLLTMNLKNLYGIDNILAGMKQEELEAAPATAVKA